jgi:hypothetical protein
MHMIETTWKSLGLDHLPMTDKLHIVEKLWEDLNQEAEAQPDARKLFLAVTDLTNGVLPWIKVHW